MNFKRTLDTYIFVCLVMKSDKTIYGWNSPKAIHTLAVFDIASKMFAMKWFV